MVSPFFEQDDPLVNGGGSDANIPDWLADLGDAEVEPVQDPLGEVENIGQMLEVFAGIFGDDDGNLSEHDYQTIRVMIEAVAITKLKENFFKSLILFMEGMTPETSVFGSNSHEIEAYLIRRFGLIGQGFAAWAVSRIDELSNDKG